MDIVRDQERCTPMAQIVKRVVFGNPAFTNHDPAPCLGAGHVARAAQGVAHAVKGTASCGKLATIGNSGRRDPGRRERPSDQRRRSVANQTMCVCPQ